MTDWMKIEGFKVSEIPFMYHYQPWNLEWIDNLLTNRQIYFSQPGFLNDPWDCRPYYDAECVDNPADHQAQVDYFVYAGKKQGVEPHKLTEIEKQWRADKELVRKGIIQASEQSFEAICAQYRIYCLSPNSDCQLMWGHYAQAHKGVCLEFSTRNDVFCSALKVIYSEEYPKLSFATNDPYENLIPLLVKSKPWGYENEYRLLSEEDEHAKEKETLRTKKGFLTIPDESLKTILVGINTPDEELEKLKKLIKEKNPRITLKRAIRNPHRYKITFQQIAI